MDRLFLNSWVTDNMQNSSFSVLEKIRLFGNSKSGLEDTALKGLKAQSKLFLSAGVFFPIFFRYHGRSVEFSCPSTTSNITLLRRFLRKVLPYAISLSSLYLLFYV